ncbi:MAG: oligosaccharide flippase family protein [Verrucomicrobiota bacterium]
MNSVPETPLQDHATHRRALILRGVAWNSLFQVFLVAVNFVSMLVLVRLLQPAEFGRATATTGILGLINCFNCSYFIAQAIQLRDGEEPDWSSHWRAGFYIQFALTITCNAVAGLMWLFPAYRPMAPLLHIASIGLLIDCPNQLGLTSLRRDMDFRRLRLVQMTCALLTLVSSITLALLGAGAYALIIASNVLHGLPLGFYWLVIKKWRPPAYWWRWPDWTNYRASLNFGAQLSGSAVLTASRGMLESLVLPGALGYAAVGLLNRAQVLFTTTVGRVTMLIVETVYPLLPRSAADPVQFARHATLFVQTMLLISIPGAVFIGLEGPYLSRLLYGSKWSAADPLILPGTIFAWGVATVLIFTIILQAKNHLRLAFLSNLTAACLCLPAMLVALAGGKMLSYAWALAGGQFVATLVVVNFGTSSLKQGWMRSAVIPPVVVALLGAVALVALNSKTIQLNLFAKVLCDTVTFGVIALVAMRFLFGSALRETILRLPGKNALVKFLRL